jgi:hypothetical protein
MAGFIPPSSSIATATSSTATTAPRLAASLGSTVPFQVIEGTIVELEALAIRLNYARRQLTTKDRRELVEKLALLGHAPKAIAEQIGTTERTVYRDLGALTNVKGGDALPTERVGKDGKTYPTQYTPRPANPEAAFSFDKADAPPATEIPTEEVATVTTKAERLRASAKSPEGVQKICDAAAEVLDLRDRLVAIAEILDAFPSRELRRKFVTFLGKEYR